MAKKKSSGISRSLKKAIPQLLQAQEQNLNEADTVFRIVKVFEAVLGYDALNEISRETQIKRKYIDLVIKINNNIKLLIEVKAANIKLRNRHIEQAYGYAARNNYEWILLTNGVVWTLYHLTFEEGIEYETAFSVNLGKDDFKKVVECMSILQRDNIASDGLDDFWQKQVALNPVSIGKVLFNEDILKRIRREIRKEAGISIDIEDLSVAIRDILSQDAREQIGPLKIRKSKKKRKQGDKKQQPNNLDVSNSDIKCKDTGDSNKIEE